MMRRPGWWCAYGGVLVFLAVFLAVPFAYGVGRGLDPAVLGEVFATGIYRDGLANALRVAAGATALSLIIGLPVAWLLGRCRLPGHRLGELVVVAPLILPPFVGALGIQQVLGRHGILNALLGQDGGTDWLAEHRLAAVCVVEALHLFPVVVLLVRAAVERLDASLLEAARSCGCGPWGVQRRVVLPLVRPAVISAAGIVAVWSFTELGTPLMLGFERITPVQVYNGIGELGTNPMPYGLVVVMILAALVLYVAIRACGGRERLRDAGKVARRLEPLRLRGGAALAGWAVLGIVGLLTVLPHLAVLGLSIAGDWHGTVLPVRLTTDHLAGAMADPSVLGGVANSLRYAGLATVLALGLGLLIAWITVRWRPPGWRILDAAAMAPLAIPGMVLAFGYLALATSFKQDVPLLDLERDPTWLLVIAYAVRRLPHMVRAIAAGLQQTTVTQEEAAAACGAGPWSRLRRVVLPQIAASIAAGCLLTFCFSLLEVADSLMLAQREVHHPVARVIYELAGLIGPGPSLACAFGVWAMAFLAACLLAARVLAPAVRREAPG